MPTCGSAYSFMRADVRTHRRWAAAIPAATGETYHDAFLYTASSAPLILRRHSLLFSGVLNIIWRRRKRAGYNALLPVTSPVLAAQNYAHLRSPRAAACWDAYTLAPFSTIPLPICLLPYTICMPDGHRYGVVGCRQRATLSSLSCCVRISTWRHRQTLSATARVGWRFTCILLGAFVAEPALRDSCRSNVARIDAAVLLPHSLPQARTRGR